ncbi:NAD+ synthase [candidate division WOR-3 bacterium]|nr:NAD+ synthase [candidate division WOR-3 bacterium]
MNRMDIEKVKKHLIERLREEIEIRGFRKGVVGVSGGLDSASVLALLTLSIGKKNTIAVVIPYEGMDEREATAITERFGVKTYKIDITSTIDNYFRQFPDANRIRRGNKMARERMSILYDISALLNALVIGTGNKTEYYLGYFTLFGDGAYAINPIGDLYKTELRQLAPCLGIPKEIIEKIPSARLWKGQTDEDDLGYKYEEIDKLLYYIIDQKYSREKLLGMGFKDRFIDDILDRINKTGFKRKPPFIIRIKDKG